MNDVTIVTTLLTLAAAGQALATKKKSDNANDERQSASHKAASHQAASESK